MKKPKLIVLETHPVPYRVPLHRRLCQNKNLHANVFFCSDTSLKIENHEDFGKVDWELNLEGINHKFLKNYCPFKQKVPPKCLWNFEIVKELIKNRPDAILIYGYQSFTNKIAFIAARIFKIPIIFRDEIDFIDYSKPLAKKIKRFILPLIFKIPSAFLYSYTRSKDFYISNKIPQKKLFFHPCAVDNDFFQRQAKNTSKEKSRSELEISKNSKVVLYVGRLDKRKHVMDILEAYEKINVKNKSLIFVGGGKQKEEIENYTKENYLKNVKVISFVERKNLYKYYSSADLFVIPSDYDPSPKSMNEAMNFSLPVITSENVGTAKDLVKRGKNGFIVKVGDVKGLSKNMEKILGNEILQKKMGKESLRIVSKWNFGEDVKATLKAMKYICEK